jgi:predicted phage baseplate assembly protein
VAWRPVAADDHGVATHWDIDGDQGHTLRFGDGIFGLRPAEGTVFEVRYRTSQGASGNVPPDSVSQVDPAWASYINSARNPFAVTNGADAETAQHIVRMTPQAFRAVQYRAVRPEDYQAAAETLPWVLKAGTGFRWTGSWLTVFTSVDTVGGATPSELQQQQLVDLLNRRRLAGYESYAPTPVLVAIDLQITVCALPGWLSEDVEAGVLDRLGAATRPDGSSGFFFADRFTFGTPLYRSRLEAAVQGVPGVNGVLSVAYRRRGDTSVFLDLPEILSLGAGEILRVENNLDYPERGTIRVFVEGGR